MKVRIDDSSLRSFEKALTAAVDNLGTYISRAMLRSVQDVRNDASLKAPVKTGTLRRSITYALESGGMVGLVGTNLVYAPFQEFGTRFIEGKYFLKKSLEKNISSINDRFKNDVAGQVAKKITR